MRRHIVRKAFTGRFTPHGIDLRGKRQVSSTSIENEVIERSSDLHLENFHLGSIAQAPLESAYVDRVLHGGLVGVGVLDVTPSTFKSVPRVGLV
ncbi:hypothetical protein GW17_00022283 [Ensete ventricosum]|nr:hypothetical protein GW17_00022283 [Ensete ventricosum]